MNAIDTILRKLPKAKTAADFTAATADLEREHTEALAAVETLEAEREDRIFSGGSLSALEGDIATAQAKAKTIAVALGGAQKRHGQATEAERVARLVAVGKRAVKLNGELRSALTGFAQAAETLATHAGQIKALRHKLRGLKAELVTGGRGDLAPRDPVNDAAAAAGRPVRDPLGNLSVPEFWPAHPDGAALSLLKK